MIALFNIFSCWVLLCHQLQISSGEEPSRILGTKYFLAEALRDPGLSLIPGSLLITIPSAPYNNINENNKNNKMMRQIREKIMKKILSVFNNMIDDRLQVSEWSNKLTCTNMHIQSKTVNEVIHIHVHIMTVNEITHIHTDIHLRKSMSYRQNQGMRRNSQS